MNLCYSNRYDESLFYITDFSCDATRQLLELKGLYKIFWAMDDDLEFWVDGYRIGLDQSQLLFCTPLNVVHMEGSQQGVVAILFNREFYCIRDHDREVSCYGMLFYGSSQPSMVDLDDCQQAKFQNLYQIMLEEFETTDNIQGEMLRVLLKRWLIKATRLIRDKIPEPQVSNEHLDLIRRFNVLVEEYYREKHLVADYADMLNKSPKTLSRLMKKYSDRTPLMFINERILLEAKRLLLFSDKTAEQIAYQLGYNEPSHFSKFFKKKEGVSPIEFRKQIGSVSS